MFRHKDLQHLKYKDDRDWLIQQRDNVIRKMLLADDVQAWLKECDEKKLVKEEN